MGVLDKLFEKHKVNPQAVKDLTIPPNRKKETKPSFQNNASYPAGKFHQIDLLYLPEDVGGDKYLLVIADIGSPACDVKALAKRDAKTVLNAIDYIYKNSKYLKPPNFIHVDAGTEFTSLVKEYPKRKIGVRVAATGRHSQQSIVESLNRTIGEAILKIQLNNALANDEPDSEQRDWIDYLPDILELLNSREKKPAPKEGGTGKPQVKCKGNECNTFMIGDKVRVLLDHPQTTKGKRLYGTFRSGDIKWSVEPYVIDNIFLLPNTVIRYSVKGKNNNTFSKFELQPFKTSVTKEILALPKLVAILEQGIQTSSREKDTRHVGDTIWKIKYNDGIRWEWRIDFIANNKKYFIAIDKPSKAKNARVNGKTYNINKEGIRWKNGDVIQELVDKIPSNKNFVLANNQASVAKFAEINENRGGNPLLNPRL
jgi:hypothetical protein